MRMNLGKLFRRAPAPAPVPQRGHRPAGPSHERKPPFVDRRAVSGARVLCRCTLELPKRDAFAFYRERRDGFMVMNVRGGSLYLQEPLDDDAVRALFPRDRAVTLDRLTLYSPERESFALGSMKVRYLHPIGRSVARGLVLRFVELEESQIDLLNAIRSVFPIIEGAEDAAVPHPRRGAT